MLPSCRLGRAADPAGKEAILLDQDGTMATGESSRAMEAGATKRQCPEPPREPAGVAKRLMRGTNLWA